MTAATIHGPTILTHSGSYFNFLSPQDCPFTLDDIAHGLSNICRFGGQCDSFYSVAEHSVYVASLVPDHLRWAALMHDAAEAFIGDMPKPLKELLPDYKAVERRVEAAIAARFDLPAVMDPAIKHADRVMLRTEQHHLMQNNDDWRWTDGVEPAPIAIFCLSPEAAKRLFLDRAEEYRP